MLNIARGLIFAATVALLCCASGTRSAIAQDYWNNHWRWYDSTYRPYYRRYYYGPTYYGPTYYGPASPAVPYSYGSPYGYYNNYYYGPSYVTPGVGVRVAPLRYGWW